MGSLPQLITFCIRDHSVTSQGSQYIMTQNINSDLYLNSHIYLILSLTKDSKLTQKLENTTKEDMLLYQAVNKKIFLKPVEQKTKKQNLIRSIPCPGLFKQVKSANNFYASFQEVLFMFFNMASLEQAQLLLPLL